MCVGCWLINGEVKHYGRYAHRQNKELHHVRSLCHVVTTGI